MTEVVEKHIKKLYQLEKKAICRFVDEKIKKRIKNTVLRRC